MLVLAPLLLLQRSCDLQSWSLSHLMPYVELKALPNAFKILLLLLLLLDNRNCSRNRNTCVHLHHSEIIVVCILLLTCVIPRAALAVLTPNTTRLALDRCRSQACQVGCLSGVQDLRHAGES